MNEEKILEILADMANGLEALAVDVKRQIAQIVGVSTNAAVKEETFKILKFEDQQGAKIGAYGVAYKANNIEDKWTCAFNILRQNNATISNRYHGQGCEFAYWLYGQNKIYRQALKK
jgi:hypothetical protein